MAKKPLDNSSTRDSLTSNEKTSKRETNPPTMEELLASQTKKLITIFRGQQVEGEIVSKTEKEIILDLGTKSEGIIAAREIPDLQLKDLKTGNKLKAYVAMAENEHGQVVLSWQRQTMTHLEGERVRWNKAHLRGSKSRGGRFIEWSKFIQAQNQKTKLQGKVVEVNKGGLIVEIGGARGFLPNSQVGFELLSKSGEGLDNLIGQDLTVTVIEVDQDNNKLIFSERGQVSGEVQEKLKRFKNGQKVKGKVVAILPFGLVVDVEGSEGLVFISDVSWEKVDDLQNQFAVGQELTVLVSSLDAELGRLNLSIKQKTEDPFAKLAKNYPADGVVKGVVTEISEKGVAVKLEGNIEGFLPASKMNPDTTYEAGKSLTLLVDSVDMRRRRINLAPFITSTAGLIYK